MVYMTHISKGALTSLITIHYIHLNKCPLTQDGCFQNDEHVEGPKQNNTLAADFFFLDYF